LINGCGNVLTDERTGGHTTEMLQLLSGVNLDKYLPRLYIVAGTDHMSADKARTFETAVGRGTPNASSTSTVRTGARADFVSTWPGLLT